MILMSNYSNKNGKVGHRFPAFHLNRLQRLLSGYCSAQGLPAQHVSILKSVIIHI